MDERETVIAALRQIIVPFFLRITHDIVVSWQRPVGQFSENGQIGLIDGILDRIAGIVYKVACIHDEIRLAGKRLVESRLHQRIAMLISRAVVQKTYLRITQMNECKTAVAGSAYQYGNTQGNNLKRSYFCHITVVRCGMFCTNLVYLAQL